MSLFTFRNIFLTLKVYLLALIFFTLFRATFFLFGLNSLEPGVSTALILKAFVMGLRFDLVICGYIVILPYVCVTIAQFSGFGSGWIKKISFYYLYILFALSFMVCCADIPYFLHFFSRFSFDAFKWIDTPGIVFGMVLGEPELYLFFIPFILAAVPFYFLLRRIFDAEAQEIKTDRPVTGILLSLLFLGMMFLGIRGRVEESSPIRVGTAYFSDHPFINLLGLNPNFTLVRSYLDTREERNKPIELMDDKKALSIVQNDLKIVDPDPWYPLLRQENYVDSVAAKPNIVIVIMESMLARNMERNGNTHHLTPFLDSIANKGYYFENAYSAGIHTYNGIFSTLFSFPAIYSQHPMKEGSMFRYHGMATTLKHLDYSTIYFMTHDGQFDNNEGFLRLNDFDRVISQKDYPQHEVKTALGVPDDYMFRYSMPLLNKLGNDKKPFFAVFLTISNHPPYYIPPYFKGRNTDRKEEVVEYADNAMQEFIRSASSQKWFKNTLFVFVSDHGVPVRNRYAISLDCNHIPLIFYSPELIKKPQVFSQMAGQIDVFPSIMGLLKLPFDNNTLGINLFRDKRPYIYFNGEDKYGVIDKEWFLIERKDGFEGLYRYVQSDTRNYSQEKGDVVKRMKWYAESNMQSFQYVTRWKAF